VARYDRLHARPPTHDVDRWTEGRVVDVTREAGAVVVAVRPVEAVDGDGDRDTGGDSNGPEPAAGATAPDGDAALGEPVALRVSDAVYDLFVRRVADEDSEDGAVLPGAPVWYRARG
jgi:hypothetical protein